MVSNNAVGSVDAIDVFCAELVSVWACTAKLLNLVHDWVEDVCIIVGQLVLEDRDDTFETHASVHVFGWERFQGSIFFAVKLDKDIIPDFDDCWVVTVDEMGNLTTTYPINMYFTVMAVDVDYSE